MVEEVTSQEFKSKVLESELLVLVDFWAEWCGPCRMVSPIVEDIAKQYEGRLKVFKLNVDENPDVAGEYGVSSIPTILFFKEGKEIHRIVGAAPRSYFVNEVERVLSI